MFQSLDGMILLIKGKYGILGITLSSQDQLCGRQTGLSDELNHLLQELTTLNRNDHGKVALRARQVCFSVNLHFITYIMKLQVAVVHVHFVILYLFFWWGGGGCFREGAKTQSELVNCTQIV